MRVRLLIAIGFFFLAKGLLRCSRIINDAIFKMIHFCIKVAERLGNEKK